jgi:hypothetical protein
LTKDNDDSACAKMQAVAPRIVDGVLNELVYQRLNGYYFLPSVSVHEGDAGFVVLLREIQHMPRRLASAILKGISRQEFEQILADYPELIGRLAIKGDDAALPIGILRSPNIEHLMQCFSMLFGRVGIPDPSEDYVNKLLERQPTMRSTA